MAAIVSEAPRSWAERIAHVGIIGLTVVAVGWPIAVGLDPILLALLLTWGLKSRHEYVVVSVIVGIQLLGIADLGLAVILLALNPFCASLILLLLMWGLMSHHNYVALPAAFVSALAGSALLVPSVWLVTLPWLGEGSAVKYFFAAVCSVLALSMMGAGGGTLWSRLVHREIRRQVYA